MSKTNTSILSFSGESGGGQLLRSSLSLALVTGGNSSRAVKTMNLPIEAKKLNGEPDSLKSGMRRMHRQKRLWGHHGDSAGFEILGIAGDENVGTAS